MTTGMDPYKVLGVPATADEREIRSAFRKLALVHHPDLSKDPSATKTFQKINDAYQFLSDPVRKLSYDRIRSRTVPNQPSQEETPEEDDETLESATCPSCNRRKNPGFRTCYSCRPQEEICPECGGFKRPRYRRCYFCRFN